MTTAIIGFPNYVTEGFSPTFSGGSWNSNFPLSNLLSMGLGKGATRIRSNDATTTSTQFTVNFNTTTDFKVISLINTNLSKTATWRIVIANTSGTTLLDTGFMTANPALAQYTALYWGHPSLHDGLPDTYVYNNMVRNSVYVVSPILSGGRVTIFINDTSNPNGYVQFAGLFVGGGWQPTVNMALGASLTYEDNSQIQTTFGGLEYIQKRQKRRIATFSLADISQKEASTWFNLIMLTLGTTGNAFLVWDPADTEKYLTHCFLCRMRELGTLEAAAWNVSTQGYKLSEVLT